MATVVRMPAALAGVTEGAIQTWMAAAGDTIAAGQPLAEIETEKAVVELESEVGGTVARLLVEPGENVAVGVPIAVILADGEGDDAIAAALAEAGRSPCRVASAPTPPSRRRGTADFSGGGCRGGIPAGEPLDGACRTVSGSSPARSSAASRGSAAWT